MKSGNGSLLAALAALSLTFTAPLSAQTALAEQDAELFSKFDLNGDGQLSQSEVGAWSWGRYDQDGNGKVSTGEFLAGRMNDRRVAETTADAERAWKLLDWNGSGWLSGTELDNGLWLKFDANNDGEVTQAEFMASRAQGTGQTGQTTAGQAWNKPRGPATRDEAVGGPPAGRYGCHYTQYGHVVASGHMISVLGPGEYQFYNRGTGRFAVDAGTGALRWLSGPLAGSGVEGSFYHRTSDGRPTIKLVLPGAGVDHMGRSYNQTNYCVHA